MKHALALASVLLLGGCATDGYYAGGYSSYDVYRPYGATSYYDYGYPSYGYPSYGYGYPSYGYPAIGGGLSLHFRDDDGHRTHRHRDRDGRRDHDRHGRRDHDRDWRRDRDHDDGRHGRGRDRHEGDGRHRGDPRDRPGIGGAYVAPAPYVPPGQNLDAAGR